MRYNAVTDHDDTFAVPEMYKGDKPIYIGITSLGSDGAHDGAERWAYSVATGPWDADVQYQGEDLHGPVSAGPDGYPGPDEMVTTLMSFLGAYAEGYMQGSSVETSALYYEDSLIAIGESAWFISENGERFGITASELAGGYLKFDSDPVQKHSTLVIARYATYTGKTDDE